MNLKAPFAATLLLACFPILAQSQETSSVGSSNQGAVYPVLSGFVQDVQKVQVTLKDELKDMMIALSRTGDEGMKTYVAESALSAASLTVPLSTLTENTAAHLDFVRNRLVMDDICLHESSSELKVETWVQGINHYSDTGSDGNAPGYRLETWGVNWGTSIHFSPRFMAGLGFGYMHGKADIKGGYGQNRIDSYNIDLFARYASNDFSLLAVVAGGFSDVDINRYHTFRNQVYRADGNTDGSQILGLVEAAYDFELSGREGSSRVILQPLVNISSGYSRVKGFNETGELANAAYSVNAQSIAVTTLGAGFRFIMQRADSYRWEIRAMVTQQVSERNYDATVSYLGAQAQSFAVTGVRRDRTAFVAGTTGYFKLSGQLGLFADVGGEFRNGTNAVNTSLGLTFSF